MSATTSIQWCDRTWNPIRGCSVVSPGCVNCYAMKQAHRFSGKGRAYEGLTKQTKAGPQWTGDIRFVEEALSEPWHWRNPQRVFVNSMSDLFHDGVSDEEISRVFASMALAPQHTFQILTKRAARMFDYIQEITADPDAYCFAWAETFEDAPHAPAVPTWPLPNVWLGVSCENQERADARIPLLLQTPAAVRFISAEPLLGNITLSKWLGVKHCGACHPDPCPHGRHGEASGIDWVIVGGESGPGARICNVEWIRSIVKQCADANVACFVKQLGGAPLDWNRAEPTGNFRTNPETGKRQMEVTQAKLRDRKGGDPSEWPVDLGVREFPDGASR